MRPLCLGDNSPLRVFLLSQIGVPSGDLQDSGAGGPAHRAQTKQEDPEGCWESFLGRGQEVRA